MNSNALAQLKKEHADMSNLHRVSLRSAVFISLMSTSLGGKKDRPSSVSSFLGTTLLDNPKTRIFEVLSACGICRPYFSTMQLMKGISRGFHANGVPIKGSDEDIEAWGLHQTTCNCNPKAGGVMCGDRCKCRAGPLGRCLPSCGCATPELSLFFLLLDARCRQA